MMHILICACVVYKCMYTLYIMPLNTYNIDRYIYIHTRIKVYSYILEKIKCMHIGSFYHQAFYFYF